MSIDNSFEAAIESGEISGVIILGCNSQGHEYCKLLGERTTLSGQKVKHQIDDILYLASGTKLITAIAALRCVERGLLQLDTPLNDVAPELPNKLLNGDLASPITLRQLLTHTSGIGYHTTNPALKEWRDLRPSRYSRVPEVFNYPLLFQPGTGFEYGAGLDWAGFIIERITKRSLLDIIQEFLGSDSSFMPVTNEDLRSRMIDLNPNDPKGTGVAVLGGLAEMNEESEAAFGGHGLCTSTVAYLSVLKSILKNDGVILRPETVEEMFQDQLGLATETFEKVCESPFGPFIRVGTTQKVGYGISGLLTLEDVPGWYGDKTLTWGGGLTLAWFIDRQNDVAAVCAIQATIPTNVQAVTELKQVFRRDIYEIRKEWMG